jgi:hypothetical protein
MLQMLPAFVSSLGDQLPLYITGLVIAVVCVLFSGYWAVAISPDAKAAKSPPALGVMEISDIIKQRAANSEAFTESELDNVQDSLQLSVRNTASVNVNWASVRDLVHEVAHLPYKEWAKTEQAADLLEKLIGNPSTNPNFRKIFEHVLKGGHWDRAAEYASVRLGHRSRRLSSKAHLLPGGTADVPADIAVGAVGAIPPKTRSSSVTRTQSQTDLPWVVVVAGLNGIRKTTAVYQPWFQEVLHSALTESGASGNYAVASGAYNGPMSDLPTGDNSFFRQLDFIMATVACQDFKTLYEKVELSKIGEYAELKNSIFARHRMLAEMVGVLLLKEARSLRMNIMLETSGKDITSLHYIDHLFPEDSGRSLSYNKLLLHFTVNDLKFAEESVSVRMEGEMRRGHALIKTINGDVMNHDTASRLVEVNAGGPYGPGALANVLTESNRVMDSVFNAGSKAKPTTTATTTTKSEGEEKGKDKDMDEWAHWYKARIHMNASADKTAWSASAAGSEKMFKFGPQPHVAHHNKG